MPPCATPASTIRSTSSRESRLIDSSTWACVLGSANSLSVNVEKYSFVSTMKKMSSLQTTQAAFSSVNSGFSEQPRAV